MVLIRCKKLSNIEATSMNNQWRMDDIIELDRLHVHVVTAYYTRNQEINNGFITKDC